jgi:hypothetical protein
MTRITRSSTIKNAIDHFVCIGKEEGRNSLKEKAVAGVGNWG